VKAAQAAAFAAVLLASASAGFFAYQHWAPARTELKELPAAAATKPAAAAAAPATSPAAPGASPIPEEVPDLRLPDMAGQPHALRENGGRARLFNFWASWCEPCRREIPLLNALQRKYGATDRLEIVGIAVDFRDAVRDFLATTQLNYTSLVGEEEGLEAAQRFGMEMALPFSVFADERNRIVAVKVGELHPDEADLILGQLRALRSGATTVPAARAAIATSMKSLSLKRAKQSAPG
jgi:thiol-disulfide isomerase/thioredoxin